MRKIFFAIIFCFCAGCQNGSISDRDAGAVAGGTLGAGLGAIIGHVTGSSGAGIAIGAVAGALSGGLIGNQMDQTNSKLDERGHRLDEQQKQIEENRRILEQLKNAGTDARSTERGIVVNLPDVLFEFDSARLTPEATQTAAGIAHALNQAPGRTVSVEGHTDSLGTIQYNQKLSEQRARAVGAALTASGVARRRLIIRGKGQSEPIASNNTAAGRQRNRRVEVIIENGDRSQ